MDKIKLVICGSIALDRIMSFAGRYKDLIKPDKLDSLSLSQLLDSLHISPGGIGANIAFSAALLGNRPILLGSVGSDAKDYMQSLANNGVDTSHVNISDLATSSFNVFTDSDGNQIGGFYPGAMGDSQAVSLLPWADQNVLAVISAYDPATMNRLVAECQQHNIKYMYDPGQQVANPTTDLALGVKSAELLCVNEYELTLICEQLKLDPEQLKAQAPLVITTMGKNGSLIEGTATKERLEIPIATPKQVVDPTGAGDGYRAGFLHGYLRQWDLRTSGQLGATIASFVVEHQGTQPQFSKQQVMSRYKQHFNEEIKL